MFGQVGESYPDPMHVGDFPKPHALEVMVEAGGGEGLEVAALRLRGRSTIPSTVKW